MSTAIQNITAEHKVADTGGFVRCLNASGRSGDQQGRKHGRRLDTRPGHGRRRPKVRRGEDAGADHHSRHDDSYGQARVSSSRRGVHPGRISKA